MDVVRESEGVSAGQYHENVSPDITDLSKRQILPHTENQADQAESAPKTSAEPTTDSVRPLLAVVSLDSNQDGLVLPRRHQQKSSIVELEVNGEEEPAEGVQAAEGETISHITRSQCRRESSSAFIHRYQPFLHQSAHERIAGLVVDRHPNLNLTFFFFADISDEIVDHTVIVDVNKAFNKSSNSEEAAVCVSAVPSESVDRLPSERDVSFGKISDPTFLTYLLACLSNRASFRSQVIFI